MVRAWHNIDPRHRVAVTALAAAELVCVALAAADLARRPSSRVRGSKAVWWPVIFIQPVGPPAYLIWGRRGRR